LTDKQTLSQIKIQGGEVWLNWHGIMTQHSRYMPVKAQLESKMSHEMHGYIMASCTAARHAGTGVAGVAVATPALKRVGRGGAGKCPLSGN